MQSIKDFFIDMKFHKNIESWIIFLLTLIIILLDLFNVVDLSILSEVFLALLASLLYMTIKINRIIERAIVNRDSNSTFKFYSKRNEVPAYIHSINAAKNEICLLGVHATNFIRLNDELLKEKLRNKCKIRLLLMANEDKDGNLNFSVKQLEELAKQPAVTADIIASLAYVRPWLSKLSAIERKNIEVRLYNIFPSALYFLIDKDRPRGYAIVSPTLPYIDSEFKPAFSISNKDHQLLLHSISQSFEEIWQNARVLE